MILHLIRHGKTDAGDVLIGRRSDPPALAQADAIVAEQICTVCPVTLVTSPLRRCRAVAEGFARDNGLTLDVDDTFAEYDFGDWDGVGTAVLRMRYGDAVDAFYADPARHPPPNGEAWSGFSERIAAGVRAVLARQPAPPVLIVTHAGVMRAILSTICGFCHRDTWGLQLDHGTLMGVRIGVDETDRLWGQVRSLRPAP